MIEVGKYDPQNEAIRFTLYMYIHILSPEAGLNDDWPSTRQHCSSAASIHTYNNTRRTSNALPKNIMQQKRERETVKEEEAHFESSAMTSVIFQIYDDDDAS